MLKKFMLFCFILICCTLIISCEKKISSDTTTKTTNETVKQDNETVSSAPSSDEPSINAVEEHEIKVNSITPPAEDVEKEDYSIIPANTSDPFVGSMDLDSETEKLFYGTWKVEKLLGFANSYNDASEYPTGQKIIDDEIIINKDFFSSKGLTNYEDYQYEIKNPLYNIIAICYNGDSFYRLFKIDLTDININDEVKHIRVSLSSSGLGIPVTFFVVNNDRLMLMLEATIFELKKITD